MCALETYSEHLKNLENTDEFLNDLPRLNPKDRNNLNKPITIN